MKILGWVYISVGVIGMVLNTFEAFFARWAYRALVSEGKNGQRQFAALHFHRVSWLAVVAQACAVVLVYVVLRLDAEVSAVYGSEHRTVVLVALHAGVFLNVFLTIQAVLNRADRLILSRMQEAEQIKALAQADALAARELAARLREVSVTERERGITPIPRSHP